jgi:8-oxo-dGTP pyrophosphatase MutT (NUDIX family)
MGSVIDFGISSWPPKYEKKEVCPRILLVSTWTDGKLGLPGGGVKKGEDALSALNREFEEEIGTSVMFQDEHFLFTYIEPKRLTYVYLKVITVRSEFETILTNFHSNRKAYVDEIIAAVGYPLWVEGPTDAADYSWNNNIWGLPRHMCLNGGCFTPTIANNNLPREQLLLMLLLSNIIDYSLMYRIFTLGETLCNSLADKRGCIPMGETLDAFLERISFGDLRSNTAAGEDSSTTKKRKQDEEEKIESAAKESCETI